MVKGTTRQVIWIKGTGERLFEQAIFLVRDEALAKGGITEEALLKEAKKVCLQHTDRFKPHNNIVWTCCGAGITGLIWLATALFL